MCAWLLPATCILCGEKTDQEQDLCQPCWLDLPFLNHACPRCAQPMPESTDPFTCGACLKETPPYDATYALFFYQAPITKIITHLKFGHSLVNARILGELLATHIQEKWYQNKPLPEVIIPMPLHPQRLKERGFNQALEIARPIAKKLQMPLDFTACQRTKATLAQATLTAVSRKQNIKNAFSISHLPYLHVAVIDDVITTGQTMQEFCKILKQYGVLSIDVWCCARAAF